MDQLQVVFATDALESANPMTNNVSTPSEISGNFGSITYAKGASIVRMLRNFIGSEVFRAALHDYLVARYEMKGELSFLISFKQSIVNNCDLFLRQFSTADPEDLWEALQGQVDNNEVQLGSSIENIMKSWTEQAGFPVVSVSIVNGTATFNQERFLLRGTNTSVTNITWWVPLTWASSSDPNFENTTTKYWFSTETTTVQIAETTPEWIIFNVQEFGSYSVIICYD